MADSDDEYDRKRRDKFQGERSESYRMSDRRKDEGSRDQWSSRQRVRADYRDRYSQQYQNDMPQPKRMRYDMEDRRMRYAEPAFPSYWIEPTQSYISSNSRASDMETQPPIMTFKAFLQTQDDNITDEEAIAKYAEYKLEFRRQQLNEFFVAHKEEEWFKLKYHPEESQKRKDEHLASLRKRAVAFQEMLDTKRVDGIKVDADSGDAVIKLLDTVVIRLEGGTDLDITILDQPPEGPNAGSESKDDGKSGKPYSSKEPKKDDAKDTGDSKDKEVKVEVKKDDDGATDDEEKVVTDDKKEGGDSMEIDDGEEDDDDEDEKKKPEDCKDVAEPEDKPDPEEPKTNDSKSPQLEDEKGEAHMDLDKSFDDDRPPGVDPDSESEKEDNGGGGGDNERNDPQVPAEPEHDNDENSDSTKNGENDESSDKKDTEGDSDSRKNDKSDKTADISEDTSDEVVPLTPRPLHRTSSIFLRTISPRITKSEIETICKRYPGFLRVSLADPQPEQQWFRRGWVTFRRDVNVKDICWSLNNIRVRDCELGAIVNRDLSRRVRTVSGLSALKQVVLHDIKLCAKLIQDLDARANLWQVEDDNDKQQGFGLVSANPVLKGITDFLVDEASAEEEELLGTGAVTEDSKERHNAALKVLDRLLLYLRVVHSVDFYNQSHYPNEDEMPNRCGIMHLRGTPSSNEVSQTEISEYTEGFRTKLTSLLAAPAVVDDAELASLGAKSQDTEVEKFIQANTQELAKERWLCPLSGKKFKGPEYVRKHIFNKFLNELEEVKKEVDYFNNYLRDPKRPQLAEHPGNRSGKKDAFADSTGGYTQSANRCFRFNYGGGGGGGGGGYRGRGGFGHYGGPGGYGGRGPRGYSRGRGLDYRPVITYRDLDAPCEPEEII